MCNNLVTHCGLSKQNHVHYFREGGLNASAIVLLKPVICLGHTVICNKNNKDDWKKREKEIQTVYIDVSSILFTYNGNDLFSLTGRNADREKEKKRNGLSGRWEKKFKMPWTIHRWDG